MRVAVTGDFHWLGRPKIPDCELLLLPGDLGLNRDMDDRVHRDMIDWLAGLAARRIHTVAIAGNHDFDTTAYRVIDELGLWHYLEDEAVEILGLKIWGSPWTPTFLNWAFMGDESELAERWEKVPTDIDVLLTHGPPYGYGDYAQRNVHAGSTALANRLAHGGFDKLKLVACGHIHEGYGTHDFEGEDGQVRLVVVNGSWVDESYKPVNPPIVVDL